MNRKKVLYVPGMDGEPTERQNLPERWAEHDLEVEFIHINWAGSDYLQWLQYAGEIVESTPKEEAEEGWLIAGDSAAGKAILSLMARHPDNINRAAIFSAKIDPYRSNAVLEENYPNVGISSETLPGDLNNLTPQTLQRIMYTYALADKVVRPEDAVLEGAVPLLVPGIDHPDAIRQAITTYSGVVTDFLKQDN